MKKTNQNRGASTPSTHAFHKANEFSNDLHNINYIKSP
jgi:hypothetical protein